MGYVAMAKLLTEWRHSGQTPWLQEAPVHPLQHALKDLERAYRNFFARRGKFPRFKRKGRSESFRYPDAKQFQIDQVNSRIKLPKLGWVRYRNSREMRGVARNVTLSCLYPHTLAISGSGASARVGRTHECVGAALAAARII